MRARRIAAIIVAGLTIVGLVAFDALIADSAADALSNRGFDRAHTTTPLDQGIAYANVTFTSDGLHLVGWWMPASDPNAAAARTTVILVHGHSAEMSKIVRHWGGNLHGAGYSLMAFDLRNHGASDDGPQGYVTYGATESHDVLAAVAWVRANAAALGVDPDRIVLYGESMGAASAITAAGTHPRGVVGVISDSSYASFAYQAKLDGKAHGYPDFLTQAVVDRMDFLAPASPSSVHPDHIVADLGLPLLLMHCKDDGRLSASNLDVLLANAPAGTATWREDCHDARPTKDHHVDGWYFPSYNATVQDFLATV